MRENQLREPGSSPSKQTGEAIAQRPGLWSQLRASGPFALVLFGLWVILSGKIDPGHLTAGAISAVVIALATAPLLALPPAIGGSTLRPLSAIPWYRLLAYVPWLAWQVFLSSVHVAYVVLHPALPVSPRLVRFRTHLPHTLARLTQANSITLTPGTVTLDVDGDEFLVHALTETTARAIEAGGMQRRVARIFAGPGGGTAADADS